MSVTRRTVSSTPIPELPGYELRSVLLTFPPGVKGTLHDHPTAATGYVVKGEHISQWEGGEEEYYKTGDGFVDKGNVKHIKADNASEDSELLLLVTYAIKVGEPNVRMIQ